MKSYEDAIYHARLCELAERHRPMVDCMVQAISLMEKADSEVVAHTRNLFSLAFKNLAGTKRSSYRLLSTEERKLEDPMKIETTLSYKTEIEQELCAICDEAVSTIDNCVLNHAAFQDAESKVFFLKMKGDYLRYKAEVCETQECFEQIAKDSNTHYLSAIEVAKELQPTNPVKLGLALNYSVFLYEIRKDHARACAVAKEAFEAAIACLDNISEKFYQDSTLIMQLLRDNMTLWNTQEEVTKNENEEDSRRQAEQLDEQPDE